MTRPTRRRFVELGLGAAGAPSLPALLHARDTQPSTRRRDTAVILYWMAGGPSHIDTFDPKPDAPAEVRGPFGTFATAVPGLRFCDRLPTLAGLADKLAVVRSVAHHEPNHPDAAHLVQTGYHEPGVQFRGQQYPAQGAVLSRARGPGPGGMPPYVCVPDSYFARQGFFQHATYLGKDCDPVNGGGEPTFRFTGAAPSFGLPADVSADRAADRRRLLDGLNGGSDEPLAPARRRAFELATSPAVRAAFDVTHEPTRARDRYGANPWGRAALLARRLVEAGVGFVTVNHYQADVDWWDDHTDIGPNLARRLPPFDRALGALVEDLHARGLAERVMVVAMGEFGRTPRVDAQAGRGHWARAMSVVFAGGGVRGGRAIGATTANGGEPARDPYTPGDVLATLYRHLGIDADAMFPDRQGRPVRVLDRGEPIRDLY